MNLERQPHPCRKWQGAAVDCNREYFLTRAKSQHDHADGAARSRSEPAAGGSARQLDTGTLNSLLNLALAATPNVLTNRAGTVARQEHSDQEQDWLGRFLAEPSPEKSLILWLQSRAANRQPATVGALARLLVRDIAWIDSCLTRQVNAILHHQKFQKLEASWRGLHYLINQAERGENIRVRVLNVSWKTLVRDLDRSIEFDQNQLFKKVYSAEFGTSGGEPFSVLLADYEIRPQPEPGSPTNDLEALNLIKEVAAAAFVPFIAGAHPSMLGLDTFSDLQRPSDLSTIFQQPEYLKWKSLRQADDSRFVGLTMPRVLMRLPYGHENKQVDTFSFQEETSHTKDDCFLWGNASFAFGAVLMRAFTESRWLADIRGMERGIQSKGMVTDLPSYTFGTDTSGVAHRCSTEIMISDLQDKELSELGFLPLCHCKETHFSAFYSSASIQKPRTYLDENATANAKISSMLQYIFCISRLAHYLKVLGREKVGSLTDASDVEGYLNDWLQRYVTQDDDAQLDMKARYPLREATAQVRAQPGKPGNYYCIIHLQPHYQLDGMASTMKLTTELTSAKT